jgi:hypothetical protein
MTVYHSIQSGCMLARTKSLKRVGNIGVIPEGAPADRDRWKTLPRASNMLVPLWAAPESCENRLSSFSVIRPISSSNRLFRIYAVMAAFMQSLSLWRKLEMEANLHPLFSGPYYVPWVYTSIILFCSGGCGKWAHRDCIYFCLSIFPLTHSVLRL